MKKIFKRYTKIYLLMARYAFVSWLSKRSTLVIFLIGKLIRYSFYFIFLYFLVMKSDGIMGYSPNQIIFFTLTFLLIDVLSQFLFRNVYTFRQLVIKGDLDLILVKPVNPLFRILFGGSDLIDFITIPPIIFIVGYYGLLLEPTFIHFLYYIILLINGLIISGAFHIFVLGFGVITTEVDHMVMIFRDVSSMARFPVDIYKEPIKSLLTFVVPIGIMATLPAKALYGMVGFFGTLSALVFGISMFYLSIKFWNFSLKKYTSASS